MRSLELSRVSLWWPRQWHRALKIAAAKRGKTLSYLVRDSLLKTEPKLLKVPKKRVVRIVLLKPKKRNRNARSVRHPA